MKTTLIFLVFSLFCFFSNAQISSAKSTNITKDTLLKIDANQQKGFRFPYFIFIPAQAVTGKESPLIVQPNNTGFPNDTLKIHEDDAKRVASNKFYIGNYVSRKLNIPLLVPVFPRPKSNWRIYTHALDRDAVLAKDELKRIDLQLIAMVNDAKEQLEEFGIKLDEEIFLTGFSASGTFVNRFALIHPEIVKGYACGGVNGIVMLPTDSINNKPLVYPLGIQDFKTIFQKDFNYFEFLKVPQFIFMGENDRNDAVQFNDGYNDSDRLVIFEALGKEMMPKRWENCQVIYLDNKVNVIFKTYEGVGHKVNETIRNEITDFFRQYFQQ